MLCSGLLPLPSAVVIMDPIFTATQKNVSSIHGLQTEGALSDGDYGLRLQSDLEFCGSLLPVLKNIHKILPDAAFY